MMTRMMKHGELLEGRRIRDINLCYENKLDFGRVVFCRYFFSQGVSRKMQ